jgi:hypothetical protein
VTIHAPVQAFGAIGACVAVTVCIWYFAKSTGQNASERGSNASPIYRVAIPAGYRDWRLISVGHLSAGKLMQLRAQLGNPLQ